MLIVDDDPDIRMLIRLTLEAAGFVVVGESSNGAAAVSDAFKLDPDFITMDVQMPYRTGLDAIEHIREIRPRAKVVVISATIEQQPEWADVFLPKTRIAELPAVLDAMGEET